jgi:hypothetical protein
MALPTYWRYGLHASQEHSTLERDGGRATPGEPRPETYRAAWGWRIPSMLRRPHNHAVSRDFALKCVAVMNCSSLEP